MQIRGMSLLLLCLTLNLAGTGLAQNGRGGGKPKDPPGPANPVIAVDGLAVMDVDGSNRTVIVESGGKDPSWSPDGEWIVFEGGFPTGRGKKADPGDPGIYVVRKDGSEPLKIAATNADYHVERPAWSPDTADGQWIAYIRVERATVDFGEVRLIQVTPSAPDGLSYGDDVALPIESLSYRIVPRYLSWSPEGNRLAMGVRDESVVGEQAEYVIVVELSWEDMLCGGTSPCIVAEDRLGGIGLNGGWGSPGDVGYVPPLPSTQYSPGWAKSHPNWVAVAAKDGDANWDLWFADSTGACPPQNLTQTPDQGEGQPEWSGYDPNGNAADSRLLFVSVGGLYSVTPVPDPGDTCVLAAAPPTWFGDGDRPDWARSVIVE